MAANGPELHLQARFFAIRAVPAIGHSAAQVTNDIRILQHLKEVEEPFPKYPIGSSAMRYKRNSLRCKQIG